MKGRTTVVVLHTYYEAEDTFDRLVWLGASSTKGKYAVRQVQFWQGGQLRQYFTNVCDPTILPLPEIARLYSRRWDIELAFLILKRELGLHLIWSSKQVVVLAQVWACLIIAQVLQAIRMEVARPTAEGLRALSAASLPSGEQPLGQTGQSQHRGSSSA